MQVRSAHILSVCFLILLGISTTRGQDQAGSAPAEKALILDGGTLWPALGVPPPISEQQTLIYPPYNQDPSATSRSDGDDNRIRPIAVGSHTTIELYGSLKTDVLLNSTHSVAPGDPFFLAPDLLVGRHETTFEAHARQTLLGARLTGPEVAGFQVGGLLNGNLFNDNLVADKYGFLPLEAFVELKNSDWRFSIGLQYDVFAPLSPTTLPFAGLAASGNAGSSFRGSLQAKRVIEVSTVTQWTFEAALSDPITTTVSPSFDINEDNGWPNAEGRVALSLGDVDDELGGQRPFEVGLSGVVGQIRTVGTPPLGLNIEGVWGVATDYRWRINDAIGLAGEFHTGRTLGTYNGAILQNINLDTLDGIRSSGGWAEGYVYWTSNVHTHIGYAVDNPRDADVTDSAAEFGRTINSTVYGNIMWEINSSIRIALETTWRETEFKSPLNLDNEGLGVHMQLRWAF